MLPRSTLSHQIDNCLLRRASAMGEWETSMYQPKYNLGADARRAGAAVRLA